MKYNIDKINLILIVVSTAIIILGLCLMVGEPSGATQYNPDIFSTRRITVGPMISLLGFVLMIFAILYKKRNK